MAWFRAALVLALLGFGIVSLIHTIELASPRPPAANAVAKSWVPTIGAAIALWLTYRFARAGRNRALQLGELLGLDAEFVEQCLATPPRPPKTPSEPAREPEGWERYS
jgi:hypothetical protein